MDSECADISHVHKNIHIYRLIPFRVYKHLPFYIQPFFTNNTSITSKQKQFSLRDKLGAIDRVKGGESRVKVRTDLGLTESTLRTWLSNGAKLRTFLVDIDSDEGVSRKRRRLGQDTDLDAAVYMWFVQARQNGIP